MQRIRRNRSCRLSRQHRIELFLRFREAVSADAVSARPECYTVRHVKMDVEVLKDYAYKMLKSTGHEEISLSSLSSSDYSHLRELVTFLIDEFKSQGINISLPSLRIDAFFTGCDGTGTGYPKEQPDICTGSRIAENANVSTKALR